MKTIAILGSTGSLGVQTIQVARKHGMKVAGLSAGKNVKLLEEQIRLLRPDVASVEDENAAREVINRVRSEHPDASHHVFAYRLKDGTTRASDDGEPSGTAGAPVLAVLARHDVTNALIVVTRYFGGTLLGTGGLVRAYGHTAGLALDGAGIAELRPWRECVVTVPYPLFEQITRLLHSGEARNIEPTFHENVTIHFSVAEDKQESLLHAIRDLTSGQSTPQSLRSLYLP